MSLLNILNFHPISAAQNKILKKSSLKFSSHLPFCFHWKSCSRKLATLLNTVGPEFMNVLVFQYVVGVGDSWAKRGFKNIASLEVIFCTTSLWSQRFQIPVISWLWCCIWWSFFFFFKLFEWCFWSHNHYVKEVNWK